MLKAVVFDFDGVIVDSEPLHYKAFLQAAQGFGVNFDYLCYLDRYVGFDDRDGFRAMLTDAPHPQAVDERKIIRLCEEKARAFESVVARGVEAIPGVLGLIDRIKAVFPLAIASGATQRDIDPILSTLGLQGCFDPIITADHVTRSKPDPATYTLAIQGLDKRMPDRHIQPHHCVAIEDTPAGIESARRAGLMTLGLATTYTPDVLKDAHRVVRSVEGLTVEQLSQWFM